MFSLDKSKFSKGKIDEQDNHVEYWMSKTPIERLEASWYLTSYAYGIDFKSPPRLDKRVFSRQKKEMIFSNIFSPDFQELIKEFNNCDVEYLLVGGYLVILNGYNRTTGDLNLWLNPTPKNYLLMEKAFANIALPIDEIVQQKFLSPREYNVCTFGIAPVSVDIQTKVKGLEFPEAYNASQLYEIETCFSIRGLSKSDLIKAKKASGRNKDLDDLEKLNSL